MSVGKKRIKKFFGRLNQGYSYLTLKYTKFNQPFISHQISTLNIDRLHVGCGNLFLKDWINIEYEPLKVYGSLNQVADRTYVLNFNVNKGLPVPDNSMKAIAGAHFIEHLDLNAGITFVQRAYQALKTGGRIRLSCPDMEIYATNYVTRNKNFFEHPEIQKACTFKQSKTFGEIFVAKAYDSGGAHKWFYDFDSLKHILETAGFRKIKKCQRLESDIPDVEKIELPEREIETLYVEAGK